jgi:hypothetical protein
MSVEVDSNMRKAGVSFAVALNGTTLSQTVEDPLGEPERPLGWEGLKAKFLSLAEPVYGDARAAAIADVIGTMGPATRMAAVTKAFANGRCECIAPLLRKSDELSSIQRWSHGRLGNRSEGRNRSAVQLAHGLAARRRAGSRA